MVSMRWLLLGVLLSSFAFADIDPHRTIADWDKSCRNYDEPKDHLLTFDDVKAFVAGHRVTSVSGLVAAMGTDPTFKPFLKSFILMHDSQSAQRASVDAEHPRVIFFKRGLVLAVTDHPTNPNPRVEVIQYSAKAHQFEFHQVDFSLKHPFQDHPTTCTQCHGEQPLPIWHTYRTWPGAYVNASEWMNVPNPEQKKYTPAQLEKMQRRLYGRDDLSADAGPAPTQKELEDLYRLFSPVPRDRQGIYAYLEEPQSGDDGQALTEYLADLNYDRLGWELKQIPNPGAYRYALLGSLLRCRNLEEFVGPQTRAKLGGKSVDTLNAEVLQLMRGQFDQLLGYAARIHDENAVRETAFNDEDDAIRFAGLRYFFEPQGVNVKRFSLNFPPGADHGYGLSLIGAGLGGWRFAFCRFIPEAVRADSALAPLLALEPIGSESVDEVEKDFCPLLKAKSRAALP